MATAKAIGIGLKLKDKVTGFAGIAVSRTDFMTGNVQYSLQPQGKKGSNERPPEEVFDQHQLEYAAAGITVIPAPTDTGIKLGQRVKDIVSGLEGIAIRRVTFMNGCVYYTVELPPSAKHGNKDMCDLFLEYRRLATVDQGVIPQMKQHIPSTPAAAKVAPGGPVFRVPMRG